MIDKLFDLHCDTLTELYDKNETLANNSCQVSLSHAAVWRQWHQVFAIWSRPESSGEENYKRFWKVREAMLPELQKGKQYGLTSYLAVEGGDLLCGSIERLDRLREAGVSILTLVWTGKSCIGGAHDTDIGLTDFGADVVRHCFACGMIPDLSHASDAMFYEVVSMAKEAGKPVIASHSNCRSLCGHRRNLTDTMLRELFSLGGICGINLYPPFLSNGMSTPETVADHILRMLSCGGEGKICLGCDLDGVERLPLGIAHIGDLAKIADVLLAGGLTEQQISGIYFDNAASFFAQSGISPLKI